MQQRFNKNTRRSAGGLKVRESTMLATIGRGLSWAKWWIDGKHHEKPSLKGYESLSSKGEPYGVTL